MQIKKTWKLTWTDCVLNKQKKKNKRVIFMSQDIRAIFVAIPCYLVVFTVHSKKSSAGQREY